MQKTMAQYKLNDKGEWIKFTVKNLHIHEQTKIMRKKGNNIDERNVRENREATKAKINEKKREIVLAATCQTLSGLVWAMDDRWIIDNYKWSF